MCLCRLSYQDHRGNLLRRSLSRENAQLLEQEEKIGFGLNYAISFTEIT